MIRINELYRKVTVQFIWIVRDKKRLPYYYKTDEEFEEYCQFAKRLGLPKPDRNSKVRPLHEK